MAKPIPVNRRWLENQQQRQAQAAATPPPPPAPRGVNYREQLRELISLLRPSLPEVDLEEPLLDDPFEERSVVPAAPAPRVIPARYEQTCSGCGERIRIGTPITRHVRWGEWVHVGCRERTQRAAPRTLVARYHGFCRRCAQPIQPGQLIVSAPGYGWLHEACAQQAGGAELP